MAHRVRLTLTTAVAQKDVKIAVEAGSGKLGTLLVSKGNIEWLPKGNHVNKKRLSWEDFARLMRKNGAPKKAK
jgi:hypothetical protein